MACLVLASLTVSRHYRKRKQNGPVRPSVEMSVNGCFREHTSFLFSFEGREDQDGAKSGPSSVLQRNAILHQRNTN